MEKKEKGGGKRALRSETLPLIAPAQLRSFGAPKREKKKGESKEKGRGCSLHPCLITLSCLPSQGRKRKEKLPWGGEKKKKEKSYALTIFPLPFLVILLKVPKGGGGGSEERGREECRVVAACDCNTLLLSTRS